MYDQRLITVAFKKRLKSFYWYTLFALIQHAVFSRRFSSEKCRTITVASFLVGAFLVKSARLLQWLVFLVGAFLVKSARLLQ